YGPDPEADAIAAADMPLWRAMLETWPNSRLDASALAVGLPEGQMGNSEVGHLNIGAGRPVLQDLPRIDAEIADGSFKQNEVLLAAVRQVAEAGSRLHLVGLIGPGGVHSTDAHAVAIAQLAQEAGVTDLVVHGLLDGRDTPPRSADRFIPDFEQRLAGVHPGARFAMIGGRYYGMDRDKRWERTKAWYDAMVYGIGYQTAPAPSAEAALAAAYERGENDEFVKPTLIEGVDGTVRDEDVVIHFNFRADRARQLTHALVDREFPFFDRGGQPPFPTMVTLTEYESGLPVQVAYPPMVVASLAEVVSGLGWRQFHVAETEKYAHVTYFMNGGVEQAWPGEERKLVPSPKVATYDLKPEMSAKGVTDEIVAAVESGQYDLIIANFANPDMVGHTGVWDATVEACTFIDGCLGRVAEAVLAADAASVAAGGKGALLAITADHGNADVMVDEAGKPVTKHSLSPVPFLLAGSVVEGRALADGVLADVTPTLMALTGVKPAEGMSGRSLLKE
ncbi:MAG: 2,3-bisphosphoglycerate-independent phosphoglycerate mutase, partial [Chloroflexota bacterium]